MQRSVRGTRARSTPTSLYFRVIEPLCCNIAKAQWLRRQHGVNVQWFNDAPQFRERLAASGCDVRDRRVSLADAKILDGLLECACKFVGTRGLCKRGKSRHRHAAPRFLVDALSLHRCSVPSENTVRRGKLATFFLNSGPDRMATLQECIALATRGFGAHGTSRRFAAATVNCRTGAGFC